MTTYAAKRHLLAWFRQQLVTELDEAQLFPEQREYIVQCINIVAEMDEDLIRQEQPRINAQDVEFYEARLVELRKQIARLSAKLCRRTVNL